MRLSTILRARGFTFAYHFSLAPYTKPPFRVRDLSNGPNTAGTKRAEQPHGLSCVARFERSAGVLADRGDLANQFADRTAS